MEADIFKTTFLFSRYTVGFSQLIILVVLLWVFRKKYLWFFAAYTFLPLLKPLLNSAMASLAQSIGPEEFLPMAKAINNTFFTLINACFILGTIFFVRDAMRIKMNDCSNNRIQAIDAKASQPDP